jgi:SAM-dependent methyltransferase
MQRSSTNTAALDAIYRRRFSAEAPRNLAWRRGLWKVLVDDFFSRWIPADGTVLDYGCGLGEFIHAARARRRIAVDLRDSVKDHLEPGIEFLLADAAWTEKLGEASVDVVFCSNLLEHLPDRSAVTALLEAFGRVLKPDGRVLVMGPNIRYSGPRYWDFFDHTLPFTHLSLVEALDSGGMETEVLIPRFVPFSTVGAWRTPLFLVRWYLRLPLVWRVVGAQFFAVARPQKPD